MKKNKLLKLIISISPIVLFSLAIPYLFSSCSNNLPPIPPPPISDELFNIQSGVLMGFNPILTPEQIAQKIGDDVLKIPANVLKVNTSAFYTNNNTTIPNSVKKIDFSECINLKVIDKFAFKNAAVSIITFPHSLEKIDDNSFENCSYISSIFIPDYVTSIGASAFAGCNNLINVTIGAKVNSIGSYTFYNCSKLSDDSDSGSPGFKFNGKSDQWNQITRGPDWHTGTPATLIKCNDIVCNLVPPLISDFIFNFDYVNLTATIVGYNGMGGDVVIPSYIEYDSKIYTIISIGSNAFKNRDDLESITIPNNVTTIEEQAFYECTSLKKVISINSTTNLNDISASNPYLYIKNSAFFKCSSLSSLTLPFNTKYIGQSAFSYCSSLTSVNIPDNVETIDNYAFSYCINLNSVNIGKDASYIGKFAFSYCASLTNVTINSKNYSYIDEHAFSICLNLTDTSGPNNTPGFKYNGTSLQWFQDIIHETNWHIETPATLIKCNDTTCSLDYAPTPSSYFKFEFNDSNLTATITGYLELTDVIIIPKCVRHNGKFYSIISIGNSAFNGSSIKNITLPNTITTIGDEAFNCCDKLTSIVIPDSVTFIGDYAFGECSCLTSVTIGPSTSYIGQFAFRSCDNLTDTSGPDNTPGFKFNGNSDEWYLVSRGKSWHYDIPATLIKCSDRICGLDDIEPSTDFIFSLDDTNHTAILSKYIGESSDAIIPNSINHGSEQYSVVAINNQAFYNCTRLSSVVIPNGIKSIGEEAFSGCSGLTSINIPSSVSHIEWNSFANCLGLNTIKVDSNNHCFTSRNMIGEECNCIIDTYTKELIIGCKTTIIPEEEAIVTSIGKQAFKGIKDFTFLSIDIPDNIKRIEDYAFADCENILAIFFSKNLEYIGKYVFSGCTSLTSLGLPNNLITIDEYAFINCTNLTSVTFGSGIKTIGNGAFKNCYAISDSSGPTGSYGFHFEGNSNIWKTVNRGQEWYAGTQATKIICKDGVVCGLDDKLSI